MDFMRAVKAMKKGKKVARKNWDLEGGDTPLKWDGANCCSGEDFDAKDWKIVEEVIKGANIEPSGDMHFYCRKCDTAPIDVKIDKDGFYICKECKSFASVVDKDEQEKG